VWTGRLSSSPYRPLPRHHYTHEVQNAARKKIYRENFRAEELEIDCYRTLDNPHILQYHGHELKSDGRILHIYTEVCEHGDLVQTFNESK